MTAPPRILLTGPTGSAEDYAEAARAAGWEPVDLPLLAIEPRSSADLRLGRVDWICVTSSNALPFLEELAEREPGLRQLPCGVVGERSAERLDALGFELGTPPAADARALAAQIVETAPAGSRILWPRGPSSDELGNALAEAGFAVEAPIAYASRGVAHDEPLPEARAVFFASPSAVRTFAELGLSSGCRMLAIAIGRTTYDALLGETELCFSDTISLPEPTPAALGFTLGHVDPSPPA